MEDSKLSMGAALQVEDLDVTLEVVTFTDPIAAAYEKYHGKVSKRRFNNIIKMRWKRIHMAWKALSPDVRARDAEFESHLESVQRSIAEKLAVPTGVLPYAPSYGIHFPAHHSPDSGTLSSDE